MSGYDNAIDFTVTLSKEQICEAVWEYLQDGLKPTHNYDLQDRDYAFNFDKNGEVSSIVVSGSSVKQNEGN